MSPDDQQTEDEARIVHPLFEARLQRLAELRSALPNGSTVTVDRALALEIKRQLDIIERGG